MKALSRKLLAFVSASLLITTTPGTAVAQSSFLIHYRHQCHRILFLLILVKIP